jgi:dephospho-CoA kinase
MKIGLIGKMGSGKTTISNEIIKKFQCVRLSFADKLKEDIIKLKLTKDGTIQKPRDRALLQNYGQLRRDELSSIHYYDGELVNLRNSLGSFFYKKTKENGRLNYENLGMSYPNYWIDILLKKIQNIEENKFIIVDDIRRMNEAKILSDNNFFIVKIECDKNDRLNRLMSRDGNFDPETLENISESEVDSLPFDFLLYNNTDLKSVMEEFFDVIEKKSINV